MAQAVNWLLLTAEARFQSQASSCGICVGQSGIGTHVLRVLPTDFLSSVRDYIDNTKTSRCSQLFSTGHFIFRSYYSYFNIFHVATAPPPVGPGPPLDRGFTITLRHTTHSSGRMIGLKQRPLPDNTQHSKQTNIHALGVIRTSSHTRGAALCTRLRPRGYWDRLPFLNTPV
jgi:hypothetical protein